MLCYWGFSVGATQTQRVPHLYKGTCMLASEIKVVGTVDCEEAVTISINHLCPLSTVEEMCNALRNALNNMGSAIDFEIHFIDTDI